MKRESVLGMVRPQSRGGCRRQPWIFTLALVAFLLAGTAGAAAPVQVPPNAAGHAQSAPISTSPALPPPGVPTAERHPYHFVEELSPLPVPTEERLRRGRALLEKIALVLTNIPLTDAPAVLGQFGLTEFVTKEYPNHIWVNPTGSDGAWAQPADVAGTGFSDISVRPWIKRAEGIFANIDSTFSDAVCASVEEVRRTFGAISERNSVEPFIDAHPVSRPKPLNEIGYLRFSKIKNKFKQEGGGIFVFNHQSCAEGFGVTFEINQ